MKKIMIALAAIAMAVSAQAVSVSWQIFSTEDIKGPTGLGTYSGSATIAIADLDWSQEVTVDNGAFMWDGVIDSASQALESDYTLTISAKSGDYALSGSGLASVDALYNGMGYIETSSWSKDPTPPLTPTPEPTSGLLLLVGMAGLALRRRRA